MTPLKAIRIKCLDCAQGYKEVRECKAPECPLHKYRIGKCGRVMLKVIRTYCLWHSAGQKHVVKQCPSIKCALWGYRMGRRPQEVPSLTENWGIAACSEDETAQSISTPLPEHVDPEGAA